jgi:hypothetical protein
MSGNVANPKRAATEAVTVARLTSRFSRTAWCARRANRPTSSGKRNSAPPRPISPPRIPTTAPAAKAVPRRVRAVSRYAKIDEPIKFPQQVSPYSSCFGEHGAEPNEQKT